MSHADSDPSTAAVSVDPVDEIRDALEGAADRPVEERVEVFERTNEVLAGELTALDEV